MRALAPFVLLLALGCTSAPVTRSGACEDGTFTMVGELDPRTEARLALARDARRREARMLDVLEPGRALTSTRLADDELAAGLVPPAELFAIGGELFHHTFLPSEGGPAELARFGDGGPAARRCAACHVRGGAAGSGSSVDVAYEGGDGVHASASVARRAPPLAGAALLELLGQQMSADLAAQRRAALDLARGRGADVTALLATQGVSFGRLVARPDGSVDASGVEGIEADLVVRPFGARGAYARLAEAVRAELGARLGLAVGDEAPALAETQETALVAYLALLSPPVEELPSTADFVLGVARGRARFDALGCAGCHTPELTLAGTRFEVGSGVGVELTRDAEPPRFAPRSTDGARVVRAYSDLRRHRMGDALAERNAAGMLDDAFVTRPLWGLAAAGPYLHDARAAGVEDAILAHGGEAQGARDAYAALAELDRGELRLFLATLTRARRLEVP